MMHHRLSLSALVWAILSLQLVSLATLDPDPAVSPSLPQDPLPDVDVPDIEYWTAKAASSGRRLCHLRPHPRDGDDVPALLRTFNRRCRRNSIIVLPGPVYHINSPMNTTHLHNVVIEQYGRLLWSDDIDYWLSVSMPIGFQNQSTVWNFGGRHVIWNGHGVGTMDGNGQAWYDWNRNRGNAPRRPMNIHLVDIRDSVLRGLRFVQSQMWTMTLQRAFNIVLDDIYVNSTSTSQWNTLNTDGADTMYSDNITFSRWRVDNGDDAIALKANSTNIRFYDSELWNGAGIAVGSMGQFLGQHEEIRGFHVRNITMHNPIRITNVKTWTGLQIGYPPNGGGGGTGHAHQILFEDIVLDRTRDNPLHFWQCESYIGRSGEFCDTSRFKISDFVFKNITGYAGENVRFGGRFVCSAAAGGCSNIVVKKWDVRNPETDEVLNRWRCNNVNRYAGFNCTDIENTEAREDSRERDISPGVDLR
ncbi:exo-rhamnogalacturonase B [Sodiomyces alkalinus F11]|uniref:Exo-rhamnogalacturonase B n=1 Tax=Sodiomyces alkalinus (strain CBS 110278 / VKM F-3762 / F11) TaxID=1314773 RepID=A0A3N2PYI8_SODAK|nr:exo-rhamnogalacturonase B [Sodiomyces alkalinus F11]ROT39603.1 exo-rhamnogalacturonase B [Sodiomyces alkalinus F11]